jgi:hypothetical protein
VNALFVVLNELHPAMDFFKCTNFFAATRSAPDMVSPHLSPRRFFAAAANLSLRDFQSGRMRPMLLRSNQLLPGLAPVPL